MEWTEIDWSDPEAKISRFFRVHEALWLPSWRVYHRPSTIEKINIVALAGKMDNIRMRVKAPFIIHCWIRPTWVDCMGSICHGKDYNSFVGGAESSSHIPGEAADLHALGHLGPTGCARVRAQIVPMLQMEGLRMEDQEGGWIHLDSNVQVGKALVYKP